jgi:hypothetical protein
MEIPARIASVPAQIQTELLLNTNLEYAWKMSQWTKNSLDRKINIKLLSDLLEIIILKQILKKQFLRT